jgi:hypothetical protein
MTAAAALNARTAVIVELVCYDKSNNELLRNTLMRSRMEGEKMKNTETSSLPTLEKIIERDKVDAKYWRRRLAANIATGLFMVGTGGVAAWYATASTIKEGFDLFNTIIGLSGSVFALGGIGGIIETIRTPYYLDYKEYVELSGYYYVQGKMTSFKTPFAAKCGKPVEPVSYLSDLKYLPDPSNESPYRFLDHLIVEEITQNIFLRPKENGEKATEYTGRVIIRRKDSNMPFHYTFINSIDAKFLKMMQLAGKEFALLYKPGNYHVDEDNSYPFIVEKIYYPHP